MGIQNIKGTGLDFVYRWQAWDACHRSSTMIQSKDPQIVERGLQAMSSMHEYGVLSREYVPKVLDARAGALMRPWTQEIATQQEHLKKTLKTEKQGEALTAVIHIQGMRDKLYDLNRRADELSVPVLANYMGTSIQSYSEVVGGVLSQDFIRSVSEGTAKPVNEEPVRIQLDVTNTGTKYLRVKRYELYPFQESGEAKLAVDVTAEKGVVVIIRSIADLEQLLSRNGYQIARYDTSRIRKPTPLVV